MQWRWIGLVVLGAWGQVASGSADPAPRPPVNLLTAAPSVVAVSSSVANGAILPEHLVDGDLTTAWNAQTAPTSDLSGAWIAVRVPTTAHVTAIRLTAGFTRADKSGDLFTMNPRVRKVRITGGEDHVHVERALDPDVRGLQEVAVTGRGGDFLIELVDVMPGSKPAWREVAVSELEVWGTLAPSQAPVKSKPAVRVGSLDALPAPGYAACLAHAVPAARGGRMSGDPSADWIVGWDAIGLGPDLAVCRIDHRAAGATATTVEIAALRPSQRGALGRQTWTLEHEASGAMTSDGKVTLARYPWTRTESALLVEVTATTGAMQAQDTTIDSTLYRIGPTGLTPILTFQSSEHSGSTYAKTRCTLDDAPEAEREPPRLVVRCEDASVGFQDSSHHQGDSRTRYRWDGAAYVAE